MPPLLVGRQLGCQGRPRPSLVLHRVLGEPQGELDGGPSGGLKSPFLWWVFPDRVRRSRRVCPAQHQVIRPCSLSVLLSRSHFRLCLRYSLPFSPAYIVQACAGEGVCGTPLPFLSMGSWAARMTELDSGLGFCLGMTRNSLGPKPHLQGKQHPH